MIKKNNTITIKGSLGNLSLYTMNGQQIVRQKGGPTKSQILIRPSCRKIKENANEFGTASHIAKDFRNSISDEYKKFGGSYISGRLTGLFRKVCSGGAGIRGQRSFDFSLNRDILEYFEFNRDLDFKQVFKSKYSVMFDSLSKRIITDISAFNPKHNVSSPKKIDYLQILSLNTIMSDHFYDTDAKEYKAVHPDLNGKGFTGKSEVIEIKNSLHQGFHITTNLGDDFQLPDEAVIISSVGIKFYEMVGNKLFESKDRRAMRIDSVL